MIFFVSTKNDFEKTSLVETKDLNIGSEGNSFQIDNAQLSGLNKLGNSFNIEAKKINQIATTTTPAGQPPSRPHKSTQLCATQLRQLPR